MMPLLTSAARTAAPALLLAALAGCCGYGVSCPTYQAPIESAGFALSALNSARSQAVGLNEQTQTDFTPAVAQALAPKFQAFVAASTVWQNDAAAVLRSSAAFSESRNVHELGAVSGAARAYADAVTAAAAEPKNFTTTYTALPSNAIIDRETSSPPIVGAARAFADDIATGTALMQAIAPSVIDSVSQPEREAIAVAVAGAGS